jgi:hypothetical protein
MCVGAALCALADEPTWPADFNDKVAANRAAAQPGEGQSATSASSTAIAVRNWYAEFSGPVTINTKTPRGIVLSFR